MSREYFFEEITAALKSESFAELDIVIDYRHSLTNQFEDPRYCIVSTCSVRAVRVGFEVDTEGFSHSTPIPQEHLILEEESIRILCERLLELGELPPDPDMYNIPGAFATIGFRKDEVGMLCHVFEYCNPELLNQVKVICEDIGRQSNKHLDSEAELDFNKELQKLESELFVSNNFLLKDWQWKDKEKWNCFPPGFVKWLETQPEHAYLFANTASEEQGEKKE